MKLVIVESPAKARALSSFLGSEYLVRASMGHIRDLPTTSLGVDIEKDFTPLYFLIKEKRKVVEELRRLFKESEGLYLATDPDREGEAIGWHLVQVLKADPRSVFRVEFHEITPQAVRYAFAHPRKLNLNLVEAQQARRILDRLVGYSLSPLLWNKVRDRLSAGRVQSAALRIITDREKEIEDFKPQEYWTIAVMLEKEGVVFPADLIWEGYLGGEDSEQLAKELYKARFLVLKITLKKISRQPPPPFITSTLQQEASKRLGFSPERTMLIAQQLYEGIELPEGVIGLITYMRTDSVKVSQQAIDEARKYILEKFPPQYLPQKPHQFRTKVRLAQEAHEAIRPTSIFREPDLLSPYLSRDQLKLYRLIWQRFLASQIEPARYLSHEVEIGAILPQKTLPLKATSSQLVFPGFLVIYKEGDEEGSKKLPQLVEGEELKLVDINREQHFTKPPPRYTEASLIKALEEKGIGRPSTYAPIISTLKERRYVEKKGGRLYPTKLGRVVSDLLKENFPEIVDLDFTAKMEEKLDAIARGDLDKVKMLKEFYFPFSQKVEQANRLLSKVEIK